MKIIFASLLSLLLAGFSYSAESGSKEKAKVRIYLEHFKSSELHQINVRVLAKIDRRYLPLAATEVKMYSEEITDGNYLGTVITEGNGTATYTLTKEQFDKAVNMENLVYYAAVSGNDTLKDAEKKISVKDVLLKVTYYVEDSIKYVKANVSEKDSVGNLIPKEKVKVDFLVQRPLSPLKIGFDYSSTDENGNISTEFPNDLPGDKDGHLTVMARIVDDDDYGVVEYSEIRQWGIPTIIDDKTLKRSLWASGANAPISLLFFINSLIIGVWGMIFYIIYKVFIIQKLGKEAISE